MHMKLAPIARKSTIKRSGMISHFMEDRNILID